MEKIADVDSRSDYRYIKNSNRNLILRWLCTVVDYSTVTPVNTNIPEISKILFLGL